MPGTSISRSISGGLVYADHVLDYLPGFSTVTNVVDIFLKCVFRYCCNTESINENRYFSHINNKRTVRCVVLLMPFLGNIIVGIYDLIQPFQGPLRGLNDSETSERRGIIENERRGKHLDMQITEIRQDLEKFKRIIVYPDEPVELELFGLFRTLYLGDHLQKIDYFMRELKYKYSFLNFEKNSLLGSCEINENETIQSKQKEIVKLKTELLELWKDVRLFLLRSAVGIRTDLPRYV